MSIRTQPQVSPSWPYRGALAGQRVAVLGYGITGQGAVKLIRLLGAEAWVFDEHPSREQLATIEEELARGELAGCGDSFDPEELARFDLVVVSPGIDAQRAELAEARELGARLISEIAFACRYLVARKVMVTGTNGKSTTTALIATLLNSHGLRQPAETRFVAEESGNSGRALSPLVPSLGPRDVAVIEVSSFQLELGPPSPPEVAVYTNLTPEHLDRHRDFESYCAVKRSLVRGMPAEGFVVHNLAYAELSREKFPPSRAKFLGFTVDPSHTLAEGAYLEGEELVVSLAGEVSHFPRHLLQIPGLHNVENALAALLVARVMGVPDETVRAVLPTFRGLPHRLELVREIGELRFINDSKATNPQSTLRALRALEPPLILLLGGRDRGASLDCLVEEIRRRCRTVVVFGEAAERLESELARAGISPLLRAGDLSEAVELAIGQARRGDTILLSPACPSFDQFSSFAHRGDTFKSIVNSLTHLSVPQP